ncbi:bactofilin family protein [Lysobacter fragariae]
MFKKDKKSGVQPGQVDTLIGPQVVIRGDFHFSGGLYVEGRIVGKLIANGGEAAVVTIAETGVVEGELRAPNIVINGQLVGDAFGENVELQPKARVSGNVHYKVVEMIAGATLTGRLVHTDGATVAQLVTDANRDTTPEAVAA